MISIEINIEAARTALETMIERGNDFSPLFETIGQGQLARNKRAFELSGPDWTVPKKVMGKQIMVRTGALEASYCIKGAPGNVWIIDKQEAQFGSDLPYAEINHTGGPRLQSNGKTNFVPGRPIIREPDSVFIEMIRGWIVKYFREGASIGDRHVRTYV